MSPLFRLWFCDLPWYVLSLSYFFSSSKYEVKHSETLGKISLHNLLSGMSSYSVFRTHGFVAPVYVNRICSTLDVLWLTFMCFVLGDIVYDLLVVRGEIQSPALHIFASWYFQCSSQWLHRGVLPAFLHAKFLDKNNTRYAFGIIPRNIFPSIGIMLIKSLFILHKCFV